MKKIIIYLILLVLVTPIKYERNINNEKIIVEIEGEKVKYERDMYGNKIPKKIGDREIKYERDMYGNKIPVAIEKKKD